MKNPNTNQSPGLAYMLALDAATPATTGDRVRVALLDAGLRLAIEHKFVFGQNEGPELRTLNMFTCVGVFDPLREHWYAAACAAGGTFPRMWEAFHEMKPWKAVRAVYHREQSHRLDALPGRVAPGIAVLLPLSFRKGDKDLGAHQVDGQALWWVTAIEPELIRLARYASPPAQGRYDQLHRHGNPLRKVRVSRHDWNELQASFDKEVLPPEKQAA